MTDGNWNRKGIFDFPTNVESLIDLFLDPIVRRARQQVVSQIKNEISDPGIQAAATALANVQAITVQAERNRRKQRNGL